MWKSTANTASDNKQKEEIEDCRCSSGSVDAASNFGSVGGGKQQQQLNIFEDNSKNQQRSTAFGGHLTEKELAAESGDSGFISGEQIHSFQEQDDKGAAVGGDTPKYNITAPHRSVADNDKQQRKQQENTILDSGCIDEDFTEDDDYAVEAEAEENRVTNEKQQVPFERSNSAVATSTYAIGAAVSIPNSSTEPMILKQNIDGGMSEWFCNLSLQTDATTPRPQQQVAGVVMNNLDAAGRRAAAGNGNRQQQTQQQQQAAFATIPTNLTPSNAWEQFYQQDDDGDTPLHLACISGNENVVAALIRMAPHPCLFNIQNDHAQTPLHLAVLTAQPKILRMLLIAGAEPTVRDRRGNTALHLACTSGEEQCVSALTIAISASEIHEAHRKYGHRSNDKTVSYLSCARLPSDLEIRNYDGERCVHLAAQGGHIDVLRTLVLYGADINAREGKCGRTPLHMAIENCNEELANFLLDECQKLDLETETYGGLTAYQFACILNKSQMQNILEKRGAEPLTPPDSDYDSDMDSDFEDSKNYDHFGVLGYFASYNGGSPMTVA